MARQSIPPDRDLLPALDNIDADNLLALMHSDPRYSDFLGEDYAASGVDIVAATQYADDIALTVRYRRTATPMR